MRHTVAHLARLPQVQLSKGFICADCETISTCPDQCPACGNEYNIYPIVNFFTPGGTPTKEDTKEDTKGDLDQEMFEIIKAKVAGLTDEDRTRILESFRKPQQEGG